MSADEPTTRLSVDPGACRFHTTITVQYEDGMVRYHIETDCPHAKKLEEALGELSAMDILKMPYSENPLYRACGEVLIHSACPLPSALVKAAEVAAGLGLKKSVKFDFER